MDRSKQDGKEINRCPFCGEVRSQKTISELADAVEKRLLENLPERLEILLKKEFREIDQLISDAPNEISRAGLISVRASIKAGAIAAIINT